MDIFIAIFIVLLIYISLLVFLKKVGYGRKKVYKNCSNSCPNCKSPLNRIQRKNKDHILHHITFKIFDARRYICNQCHWEGLRWEEIFKQKF